MHIQDKKNNRFISEQEYESIKLEINSKRTKQEIDAENEEDNTYHNYILNTRTPEQIIKNKLDSYSEKLKAMFIGTESQAFEVDENMTEGQVDEMCNEINSQFYDKLFVPFLDEDGKYYIVEQMRAQPANAESLTIFLVNNCQNVQFNVN